MGAQTGNNRLSLNSSVFAGRVKKFDTYEQGSRSGQRTVRPVTIIPKQTAQSAAPKSIQAAPRPSLDLTNAKPLQKQQQPALTQNPPAKQPALVRPSPRGPQAKVALSATESLAMQAVDQSGSSTKSVLADQFEESRYAKNGKEKQKRSKLVIAMNSVAVVVFLFASAVSLQTLLTNQQTQDVLADKVGGTTDQEGVAQGTGRDPAEEPVSDSAIINYQVAADLPRYIRIPDIDIFARVKHTGIDSEGAVDAPANIHDVSWFTESAKPGNAIGASLLLGHVQGWSGPGVFKNIDKLETGARFMVEKGSGETLTYEVTKSQEIPVDQVNMGQILSAEDPGEHDLKLMTCAGEYDAANESYLSRFVVYAKIIR